MDNNIKAEKHSAVVVKSNSEPVLAGIAESKEWDVFVVLYWNKFQESGKVVNEEFMDANDVGVF